jgi:hypothetical protein
MKQPHSTIMNTSLDRKMKGFDTVVTSGNVRFGPGQVEGVIPFVFSNQGLVSTDMPLNIQTSNPGNRN